MKGDGLAALAALFAPSTRVVSTDRPPKVRASCCTKCPFGGDLTESESMQATALRIRLRERISGGDPVVWGCHETAGGRNPLVCPGFLAWKEKADAEA